MSEPNAVVKQAMEKALSSDSNPLMPLNATNFIEWYEAFKNQVGRYGLAGEEVLNCKLFDFTPEIRSDMWSYQVKDSVTGEISTKRRRWNSQADREMQSRNALLEKRQESCIAHRGRLWAHAYSRIDDNVKSRLKVSYDKVFTAAQKEKNCVALFQLFRLVCSGLAKDQLLELQIKLSKIRHRHGNEDFDVFLVRFETLCKQIRQAGRKITEKEKMQYLCRAVDTQFWKGELSQCHALEVTDSLYPKYKDMTPKMSKYYRSIMKPPVGDGGGKRNREPSDGDGRDELGNPLSEKSLKKRLKAHKAELMAVFTKAIEKVDKKPEAVAKGATKLCCFRCGRKGHLSRECKMKPSKCDTCGSEKHCTSMHKASEEFKERMAQGKAKKNGQNVMMEAIEVNADGIPVADNRFGFGECAVDAFFDADLCMMVAEEVSESDGDQPDASNVYAGKSVEEVFGAIGLTAIGGVLERGDAANAASGKSAAEADSTEEGEVVEGAVEVMKVSANKPESSGTKDAATKSTSQQLKRSRKKKVTNAQFAVQQHQARQSGNAAPRLPQQANRNGPSRFGDAGDFGGGDDYYSQQFALMQADSESENDLEVRPEPSKAKVEDPRGEWSDFCSDYGGSRPERDELDRLASRWDAMSSNLKVVLYAMRHRELEGRKQFLRELEGILDAEHARIKKNVDKPYRAAAAGKGKDVDVARELFEEQYQASIDVRRSLEDLIRDRPTIARDSDVRDVLDWFQRPFYQYPQRCEHDERGKVPKLSDKTEAKAGEMSGAAAKGVNSSAAIGASGRVAKGSSNSKADAAPSFAATGANISASSRAAATADREKSDAKCPSEGVIRKKTPAYDEAADDSPGQTVTGKRNRDALVTKPVASKQATAATSKAVKASRTPTPASAVKGAQMVTTRVEPAPLGVQKLGGRSEMERDQGALHTQALYEKREAERAAERASATRITRV